MRHRPTHVHELTSRHLPQYRGLVDASKWDVEGVWLPVSAPLAPFVFYFQWPDTIKKELASSQHRSGAISISDLELMRIIMHWLALEQAVDTALKHQSPVIWCDNLPAVTWLYKFRTSTSTISGAILRAFATRLHSCHTGTLSVDHISGVYNNMADVASRQHSTIPSQFFTDFSFQFQPPHHASWTLFQFSNMLTSRVCSMLLQQQLTLALWR